MLVFVEIFVVVRFFVCGLVVFLCRWCGFFCVMLAGACVRACLSTSFSFW